MVRTRIQLDDATYRKLRHKAFAEKTSLSAVVREILVGAVGRGRSRRRARPRFGFVGMVRGKAGDVSERHDGYLGQGLRW